MSGFIIMNNIASDRFQEIGLDFKNWQRNKKDRNGWKAKIRKQGKSERFKSKRGMEGIVWYEGHLLNLNVLFVTGMMLNKK